MNGEERFLMQSRVQKLTLFLMRDYGMSIPEAFGTVYNSRLYELLVNKETGLYYQGPVYLYNFLQREIKTGKVI